MAAPDPDPPLAGGRPLAALGDTVPPRIVPLRPWTGVRRRLAVRLDAAGDVLMTTPALRALRARARDEHLALLTSSAGATAASLVPELDEVIIYDPPWMKAGRGGASAADDLAMIDRLRAGAFDGAAIFTVHSQSALPAAMLCHLAGIPRRLAHCVENPYDLLTDWVPEPERDAPIRHETRRQLDLLAAVGIAPDEEHLSLHVPDVAMRRTRSLLERLGIDARRPFVVIHPGATASSRRWPPARFGAVAGTLAGDLGWPVLVVGLAGDAELVDAVVLASGGSAIGLAGRLTFPELTALIALAPLLVANNSVAAHVAAAVGTPVVDVYAMTNVQHVPWRVPSRVVALDVPCRGCRRSECPLDHHRCLLGIEPAAVLDAVRSLLAEVGVGVARVQHAAAAGATG